MKKDTEKERENGAERRGRKKKEKKEKKISGKRNAPVITGR